MRAHMGGLPETHVMYHSTHSTDITDRVDVCSPDCVTQLTTSCVGSRCQKEGESALLSGTQRDRWHARDEEHFILRDEANARTQLLQKIPLCGISAALAATHREDLELSRERSPFACVD